MPGTPTFPFTRVDEIAEWFNFHHTIVNRKVPLYLTPDALSAVAATGTPPSGVRQAQAINAILDYCFHANPIERFTALGAKWSMSNVLDPGNVIVDPGAFNKLALVSKAWLAKDYTTSAKPRGGVPVVVGGGTQIGYLNQKLGESGLALQTSGANDGHRIAGCIATGTHGAAMKIGAVHDTVLAMYVVVGPNKAALLQPTKRSFTGDLAGWFEKNTTLSTVDIADDDLFHAAQVGLGAFGFVHSVVMEAVPLYQLRGNVVVRPIQDQAIWHAIETLDTTMLDPTPNPYHLQIVFSPYAKPGEPGAFATIFWKQSVSGHFAPPSPVTAMTATDTTRLLSSLIGKVDSSMTSGLVEDILVSQTQAEFKAGAIAPLFPGQAFGPTNLPPGNGRSTEIVVDHKNASTAVKTVLDALRSEANAGRHLLGAVGVRFMGGTSALLGQNLAPMNTTIEVPSLGSPAISQIQAACWKALHDAKIPFTCHWGQEYGMSPGDVLSYYGSRVARWKAARTKLLDTPEARAVFAPPLLAKCGLL